MSKLMHQQLELNGDKNDIGSVLAEDVIPDLHTCDLVN